MSEPELRDPRLDAAYRDAAHEEPRSEIDERIRAAARRAVAAGPRSLAARTRAETQRRWTSRWGVPVSIAATVLVAVTLSYMIQDEAARKAGIDAPVGEIPRGPTAAPGASLETPAAPGAAPAKPPAAATSREAERTPDASTRPLQDRSAPAMRRDALAATPAPAQSAAETPVLAPAPAATPRAFEQRPAAPSAEPSAATPSPAPAGTTPPTAIPPAREERARQAPFAAPRGEPARDRASGDSPADRFDESAAGLEAGAKRPAPRTPEAWIEDIRRLRAEGKVAEAAAELARFRQRYPGYVIPPDLLR